MGFGGDVINKRVPILGCVALTVTLTLLVSCAGHEVSPHPPAPPMSVPGPTPHVNYDAHPVPRGWEDRQGQWELVWRDEFAGGTGDNFHNGLNLDNWNIDTGTAAQFGTEGSGMPFGLAGWGNYELQYYTRSENNVRVRDGMLILEARNDGHAGTWWSHYPPPAGIVQRAMPFTSAKVTTGGTRASNTYCPDPDCVGHPDCAECILPERFSISEGFIEARIRTPRGVGFWPAFWTMGTNSNRYGNGGPDAHVGWPRSGEIDIMEMRGGQEYLHLSTIHHGMSFPYQRWFPGDTLDVRTVLPRNRDMSSDFHVYGVRWDADTMHFYFNGYNWFTIDLNRLHGGPNANAAAFTAATGQFINLNLAVGGHFIQGASPPASLFDANAPFEDRSLMVDWVRVYRKAGGAGTVRIRGEVVP